MLSADLSIKSMTCTGFRQANDRVKVKTSITIHNENNSNARNVTVKVVLPPSSRVISSEIISTSGVRSPGVIGPSYQDGPDVPWAVNGSVTFVLSGTMDTSGKKSNVDMTLETEMLNDFVSKGIRAFVSGSLPDAEPINNSTWTEITFDS